MLRSEICRNRLEKERFTSSVALQHPGSIGPAPAFLGNVYVSILDAKIFTEEGSSNGARRQNI